MTVFKTFLKVVSRCKAPIIMYTAILIFFGGFNIKTSENDMNFVSSKPDIYIINHDKEEGITKSLIGYMSKNSVVKELEDNENSIKDAIYYRDVNYIIEIPENYNEDFLSGKNPEIKIQSLQDYPASIANNMLERYLKTANIYLKLNLREDELVNKIENTLNENIEVSMTSKLDTDELAKGTTFYNFLNYCMLAGSIYVICLVLSSFKKETVKKRTIISATSYQKINRELLLSNSLFALVLWLLYVILSFILVGKVMFTMHGLLYIINSFIFSICTLSIAFLIGNIINNKDAINGIVNVVALGSSFLCGSFVPMELLPNGVLNIAHILPSYYFIKNNNLILTLEHIDLITLKPLILNAIIVIIFSLSFILITNLVSHYKRRIG